MAQTPLTGRDINDGSIKHNDLDLSGTPAKTNPVAADYFVVVDSAAPTVLKMVSFTEASNFFIPYTGGVANVNLGVHNLTVDTNSLFVDSVNHRVGIGTTSPGRKFSIRETSPADLYLYFKTDKVDGYAGMEFGNDAKWYTLGINSNDAFVLTGGAQFSTGNIITVETGIGANALYLKANNYVGILTANPLATLNVYGNTKIGVSTRTPYKTLDVAGHINFDQVPNPTSGQVTGMTLANGGAGNIPAGTYYYNVCFYTADGETGNIFYATIPTITLAGSSQVNISNIPISTDPRVIGRKIFRSQAGTSGDYYYVYEIGTIANNTATTWTDNTAINTTSGNWMYNKVNTTAGFFYIDNTKVSQLSTVVTAYGYGALGALTRGSTTAAFGSGALASCTSGDGNQAFGHSALYYVTTGSSNNAFGYASGQGNITGSQNNSFGASALRNDSSLSYSFNVAIGTESLRSLLANNNYNTAVGHNSGRLAAGTGNTFIGATAGSLSTQTVTGSYNIAIGYGAGSNLAAGGYNVVLGYAVTIPTPANSNQLNIGNVIYATGLASGNTPSATGKTGFGIAAPTEVVHAYSANDAAMLFETATGRFAQYQLKSGATSKWIIGTQDTFSSNSLLFRNGSTDLVVITTGGLVGVGTKLPSTSLEVAKESANSVITVSSYHDTETTYPGIIFRKADNTLASPALVDDTAILGAIRFRGYDGDEFIDGALIQAVVNGNASNNTMPADLAFYTNTGSSAVREVMRITKGGAVGILTNNPFSTLQIIKDGAYDNDTTAGFSIATSSTSYSVLLKLGVSDSGGYAYIQSNAYNGNKPLLLQPWSGGRIGVGGVTSPTARLHLPAGSASSGSAPLKFTDGTLTTVAEAGAFEATSANLYYTNALNVRRSLAFEDQLITGITGTGTPGTLSYWDTTGTLSYSNILYDEAPKTVGIGPTSPTARFQVGRAEAGIGTALADKGGYTINGTNAHFDTEFKAGDSIYFQDTNEIYVIASVDDPDTMTTAVEIVTSATDGRYQYVDNYNLFSVFGNGNVGFGTFAPQGRFEVAGSYGAQFLLTKDYSFLGIGSASTDWEGVSVFYDGGSPTVSIGSGGLTGNGCQLVVDDNTNYIYTNANFGVGIATPHEAIEVVGNILASRLDSTYNATHVRIESKMGTGYSSVPASYDFYALGIGTNDGILSGDVLGRISAFGKTSASGWQDGPFIDFRAKADWTGSTYAGHNSDIAFFAPSSHSMAAMSVNYRGVEINPDLEDVNFIINGSTYTNLLCAKASVDSIGIMTNAPSSLLHVMGSLATRVVTITGSGGHPMDSTDFTVVVTYNGAASTITLPTSADCEGRIYVVKNFTGNIGGQDVIISRSGTDQIMTSSLENSITITNGKTALFQSAGSGKWIHLGTIQK